MTNSVFQLEASPYFLFVKKHYCINCKCKLERNKQKQYFFETSDEAKKLKSNALYTFDSAPVGSIYVYKFVFICDCCKKTYDVKTMKQLKM